MKPTGSFCLLADRRNHFQKTIAYFCSCIKPQRKQTVNYIYTFCSINNLSPNLTFQIRQVEFCDPSQIAQDDDRFQDNYNHRMLCTIKV